LNWDEERSRMVRRLMDTGYLSSPGVAKAMMAVPRHLFLPKEIEDEAYYDTPLPIGEGQTISAPHMVAIMMEAMELRPGQRVLEVGGGSGYHAAVMAEMVKPGGRVYSMERIEELAERARQSLVRAGYDAWVEVVVGDGTEGLPDKAPFDRISVAAAAPYVPQPLQDQLADGGRLLIPVGGRFLQELTLVARQGKKLTRRDLGGCVFVPLVGKYGFRE
jgi:protein-L-isoaspartate(D-aspartate) O-methyltransferase